MRASNAFPAWVFRRAVVWSGEVEWRDGWDAMDLRSGERVERVDFFLALFLVGDSPPPPPPPPKEDAV